MEQIFTFIGDHPILVGAFAVVVVALIATEVARLTRRWKELDTNQAIRLINRLDPLILDVSNSADFAKGHILNAEHMPPSRIEAGNQKLLKSIGRPVLVYCKSGQVSPQMATRLTRLGFEDVSVLRGGLAQWTSDQQPVSRGKSGKGSAKSGSKAGARKAGSKSAEGQSRRSKKSGKAGKRDQNTAARERRPAEEAGTAAESKKIEDADDSASTDRPAE